MDPSRQGRRFQRALMSRYPAAAMRERELPLNSGGQPAVAVNR
jgi:hypothetical protein